MATFTLLPMDAQLKAGDRVLLRYNAVLGATASRTIAAFVSRFNQERPLRWAQFELVGNPVYDPVHRTVNVYVGVTGTPLLAIVIAIAEILAAIGIIWILKDAILVVASSAGEAAEKVATGVEQVGAGLGAGLEKTGTGVGVGAALAGLLLGVVALGALQAKGVKI